MGVYNDRIRCEIAGEQGASWLWQDGNDSKKMIMHLVEHVRRGHKVPDYVFEAFLEDLK